MRLAFSVTTIALICAVGVTPLRAQMPSSDAVIRMEQLESQMRALTGQIEQLQHRNQQLEQQVRRLEDMQGGGAPRANAQPAPSAANIQSPPSRSQPQLQASASPLPAEAAPATTSGRRGDVFDPNAAPNAPGAPRPLGSLPAGQPSAPIMVEEDSVGAPGGRNPGAPLDLSSVGGPPPQAPVRQSNPGAVASVAPPSQSPRDHFDLGAGYIQRKEYASAEQTFRDFLQRYPNDRLAADAQYWLGESLFQRQVYQDAGQVFLDFSTKHETAPKAPDALLRLGQSFAAIGHKDAACATFNQVTAKYPRASVAVKQGVEREQKRVRC